MLTRQVKQKDPRRPAVSVDHTAGGYLKGDTVLSAM